MEERDCMMVSVGRPDCRRSLGPPLMTRVPEETIRLNCSFKLRRTFWTSPNCRVRPVRVLMAASAGFPVPSRLSPVKTPGS